MGLSLSTSFSLHPPLSFSVFPSPPKKIRQGENNSISSQNSLMLNHCHPTPEAWQPSISNFISYKWIVIVGTFMRLVSFIQHHAFSIHLFLNVSLYVYTRVCLTIHFLKDICVCPFLSVMTRVAVNICVHVFFFFL